MSRVIKILLSVFVPCACLTAHAQTQINGRVITPTVYFIEGSGAPVGNCSASFNYGIVYFDHTGFNIWFCANGGWTQGGGNGASSGSVNSGTGGQVGFYSTTGATISPDLNLDDGLSQANMLTYYGGSGIYAAAGSVSAFVNLWTGANLVQFSSLNEMYGGYGSGLMAFGTGTFAPLSRLMFGGEFNSVPAFCFSGLSISVCAADGSAAGSLSVSGGITGNTETVTFSATPTFSSMLGSSRIVLTGNITSFTLAAGLDGQHKCLNFIHDATGNTYTVTAPNNVLGFFIPGNTASKHNQQCFTYYAADTAWEAESVGVINE